MKKMPNKEINILIVEDDVISCKLLQKIVKRKYENISTTVTAIEAIDALKSKKHFDLVLMDIKLPKMDGLAATKEIRKFNKDIVIIAQTAYAFKDDHIKALEAGCNDYISKPIDDKKLLDIIEKFL